MSWFLQKIIEEAVRRDASDIYIQSNQPVFLRISGKMIKTDIVPTQTDTEEMLEAILKMEGAAAKLYDKEEIDTSYSIYLEEEKLARFRVNICLCNSPESNNDVFLVLRQLKSVTPDPFSLGVPEEFVKLVMEVPYGLVFIAGPTGSGKSTTLASVLGYISHKKSVNIITIEDPIEYIIPVGKGSRVAMREVGKHTLSFSAALKAAMRQKPDIVLVGEVRDPETAMAAITVAKSGHLVFTTLHTNMTTAIPSRIASMFPIDKQNWVLTELIDVMVAGMVQILIPTKEKKRRLVTEFLNATSQELKELFLENKVESVRNKLRKEECGWVLNKKLLELIKKKEIDAHVAYSHTNDIDELKKLVGSESIKDTQKYQKHSKISIENCKKRKRRKS